MAVSSSISPRKKKEDDGPQRKAVPTETSPPSPAACHPPGSCANLVENLWGRCGLLNCQNLQEASNLREAHALLHNNRGVHPRPDFLSNQKITTNNPRKFGAACLDPPAGRQAATCHLRLRKDPAAQSHLRARRGGLTPPARFRPRADLWTCGTTSTARDLPSPLAELARLCFKAADRRGRSSKRQSWYGGRRSSSSERLFEGDELMEPTTNSRGPVWRTVRSIKKSFQLLCAAEI